MYLWLARAAIAGVTIMVIDHIILKGRMFLVEHALEKSTGELSYLMAFIDNFDVPGSPVEPHQDRV